MVLTKDGKEPSKNEPNKNPNVKVKNAQNSDPTPIRKELNRTQTKMLQFLLGSFTK